MDLARLRVIPLSLKASSYEPGNRADSVTGMKLKKQPKWWIINMMYRSWTLVTSLIKLIRILLKRKYIEDINYAILTALRKRSYFVQKGIFPVTEISITNNEISVTGPGPISRKPRKLFGLVKSWQNLEPHDYRAVLFTYS